MTSAKANVPGVYSGSRDVERDHAGSWSDLPPVNVVAQKMADGVWFLGGGTHNSVLIEFKDYVAVVEAPN